MEAVLTAALVPELVDRLGARGLVIIIIIIIIMIIIMVIRTNNNNNNDNDNDNDSNTNNTSNNNNNDNNKSSSSSSNNDNTRGLVREGVELDALPHLALAGLAHVEGVPWVALFLSRITLICSRIRRF